MRPHRDHATVPERTGVLVIRVWLEQEPPGRLRARLIQAADPGGTPATLATAAGVDAIRDAVETWLEQFLHRSGR